MTHHLFFGFLCLTLMMLGMIPYILTLVRKQTTLSRPAWGIWVVLATINFFAYRETGEVETAMQTQASLANTAVAFILSWFYPDKTKWTKHDSIAMAIAVVTIIVWKYTSNPLIAIIGTGFADIIGMWFQLKKIERDPFSESLGGWTFGLFASSVNILAIKDLNWTNGLYTGYMTATFAIIWIPVAYARAVPLWSRMILRWPRLKLLTSPFKKK